MLSVFAMIMNYVVDKLMYSMIYNKWYIPFGSIVGSQEGENEDELEVVSATLLIIDVIIGEGSALLRISILNNI